MGYRQFEDLPVWRDAINLAARTYALSKTGCLKGHSGLRDQLERAALSVSNNIAEGFDRGTHEELLTFLYYALGSASEVRSMTYVLDQLLEGEASCPEASSLRSLASSISRQLGAWLESLKNSNAVGPRHRNHETRQRSQQVQRRDQFLAKLRQVQDGHTASGSVLSRDDSSLADPD